MSEEKGMKRSTMDAMQPGPYLVFFDERDAMGADDVAGYMGDRTRTAVFGPVECVWGGPDGTLKVVFRNKELQALLAAEAGSEPGKDLAFVPVDGRFGVGKRSYRNWMMVFAFRGMSIAHLNTLG